ncbi:MAG TPA: DUF3105 domain-containing protein [Baekduia sp.]|uniref:DUF3105 domain-containing protein n=1 Tax=Baekduia sp. TaxID=2600305 RepID=UPI002B59563F|nr:DUF3105 domain-containing protein [Baekduia sp.]HMJ33049.1 DUF3105 domain-containing protein [Baekduia sp.]
MSSRQEEKERRRLERQQREQAEAGKAANRRRLQLVAGGVLAIAAAAAVIAAVASSGGGGSGSDSQASSGYGSAAIPAKKISDFDAAVKASGCTFKAYSSEGRTHLTSETANFDGYKTNPPTSGTHRPTPAQDGVYAAGNSPAKENAVHALEHGRIELEYKQGAPKQVQDQLNTLFNEKLKGVEGYHQLLFQNQTNMPFEVAAVAWTHILGCKTMNPQVFDAMRAFRDRFVNKGPEIIP